MIPPPSDAVTAFLHACSPADCPDFMGKMELLAALLYEANKSFNLTAIKPDGFWSRHVSDSLSPAFAMPDYFRKPKRICDLGCGAGFPSLVLAAAFPHCTFTPVDSTRKKVDFVNMAAEKLGLRNLKAVHARGNELGRKTPFRRAYDAVTVRAVASAEILIREGTGFLNGTGRLLVYRTPQQYAEERMFLEKNRKICFETTDIFSLPDDAGTRLFLLIGVTNSKA